MANKKLSAQKTKKLTPLVKKFNQMAKLLIKSLNSQVDYQQKENHRISVLLNEAKLPNESINHTISIQTIDINDTRIKKKGDYMFKKKMEWEQEIRKQNRGTLL